jgi:heat-inducible transcriptional repressor
LPALDERRITILKAIVRSYVREGEPVGSKRLVEEEDLGVSPATVRSDMAALEAEGLIVQPHTSAGRIPTDKGYRYFVDMLSDGAAGVLGAGGLLEDARQRAALENLLRGASDLEDLLRRTSTVLSQLTRFAALVVAPRVDRSRLRHVELVGLGPSSVLAVLISDTGRVGKRRIVLDGPIAEHDLQRARHAVNVAAGGLRLDSAPDVVAGIAAGAPAELRVLLEAVAEAIRQDLAASGGGEELIVGGTANIAGPGYFDRIEQVKQVHEMLEEQVILLDTVREALASGDPAVRIGTELPLVELAACSVVAASYGSAGEAVGSLGVLGPTRMDYPRTLAAVQAVASSLEKALAELTGQA